MYTELRDERDFRPGTLNAVRHRCAHPTCVCSGPSNPGHGADDVLSTTVAGKSVAAHFRSGPEPEKAQREVANYNRFRGLVRAIVEVKEKVCEARPVSPLAADQPSGEGERGGSSSSSKPTPRPR